MDAPKEMRQRGDLRDYLAAERTLLPWIRTGLALMGFGFVVARFGLFLQELQVA
jgi:putative membrane protein